MLTRMNHIFIVRRLHIEINKNRSIRKKKNKIIIIYKGASQSIDYMTEVDYWFIAEPTVWKGLLGISSAF